MVPRKAHRTSDLIYEVLPNRADRQELKEVRPGMCSCCPTATVVDAGCLHDRPWVRTTGSLPLLPTAIIHSHCKSQPIELC